jgi:prepilin-type N-terminal cleavage/methylation domain-containing protein
MSQRAKQRGAKRVEKGFSLLELLVVILILGVLAAMAIPSWQRIQKNARLSGDAHGLTEALSIAKMRAASDFTESRVFFYMGSGPYFRVDVWNKTKNCWVSDGDTTSTCITSSATTNTNETALSTGVSTGSGSVSAALPDGTAMPTATACKQGQSSITATDGSSISSTACIQFNSRGFPVPSSYAGLYITDGTRVFGSITNAMGLVHTYEIDASGSTWTVQ